MGTFFKLLGTFPTESEDSEDAKNKQKGIYQSGLGGSYGSLTVQSQHTYLTFMVLIELRIF